MSLGLSARFQFILAAFFTIALAQISRAESEAVSGEPSLPQFVPMCSHARLFSPLIILLSYFIVSSQLEAEYQELWGAVDDKVGLEAIRSIHQQLDDDNDGTIEPSETGDFIKADLQVGESSYGYQDCLRLH